MPDILPIRKTPFWKLVRTFGLAAGSSFLLLPAFAQMDTVVSEEVPETSDVTVEELQAPITEVPTQATTETVTILETAENSGSFQTLTAAIAAAGLTETLAGVGPFTVFAPTDEAFNALPEGTIETLFAPENKEVLAKILKYHVVSGSVTSGDLSVGEVPTVEGNNINVSIEEDGVKVNQASVVQADIEASNGVIHVIDQVILPPDI